MFLAGFEPSIQKRERPQTHVLRLLESAVSNYKKLFTDYSKYLFSQ
jgi:hypothetical protein